MSDHRIHVAANNLASLEAAADTINRGKAYQRRPNEFIKDITPIMSKIYFGRLNNEEYDTLTATVYKALGLIINLKLDAARKDMLNLLKEVESDV